MTGPGPGPMWRIRKDRPPRGAPLAPAPWRICRVLSSGYSWVVSSHATFDQAVAAMLALDRGSR